MTKTRPAPPLRFRHAAPAGLGRVMASGWMTHRGMAGGRRFPRYAVAFILRGRGTYADANGTRAAVGPGDLITVFPGLPHFYHPARGTEWTEFYVVFEGPVFELWEQLGLLDRRAPVTHLEPPEVWAHRLEEAVGPAGRPGTEPPLVEVCRLQAALARMLWQGPGEAASPADVAWAGRAAALLESGLEEAAHPAAVARRLGLPYETFRKRFKRLLGCPPAHYRGARLVDRACELMQTTALSDKEIADRLGFCDPYYFSRRFKQVTGSSPRAFRAALPGRQPRRETTW